MDWLCMATMLRLLGTGVVFIYSAGLGDETSSSALNRQWFKQILFICMGIPPSLILVVFDYRRVR